MAPRKKSSKPHSARSQEKKTTNSSPKRATRKASESEQVEEELDFGEKFLGALLSAYVFETVGMLSPRRQTLLDIMYAEDPEWPEFIESTFGINRTLIRSVYALWTEFHEPKDALNFILLGMECPGGESLVEMILNEFEE